MFSSPFAVSPDLKDLALKFKLGLVNVEHLTRLMWHHMRPVFLRSCLAWTKYIYRTLQVKKPVGVNIINGLRNNPASPRAVALGFQPGLYQARGGNGDKALLQKRNHHPSQCFGVLCHNGELTGRLKRIAQAQLFSLPCHRCRMYRPIVIGLRNLSAFAQNLPFGSAPSLNCSYLLSLSFSSLILTHSQLFGCFVVIFVLLFLFVCLWPCLELLLPC